MCALRRIRLGDGVFADATCGSIQLKLLRIGARWCASASAASRSPYGRERGAVSRD
jgi:hypothetical protein